MLAAGAARAAMFPIIGIAGLVTSRLSLERLGSSGFAALSLIIGLPALVPISDFGLGAAVTDSAVRDGLSSAQFKAIWNRSLIFLVSTAALISGAATVTARLGVWSRVLALSPSSGINASIAWVLVFMALGIPLGLGQRVLLGSTGQKQATILTSGGALASLVFVGLAVAAGSRTILPLTLAIGGGPLAAELAVFMVARRRIHRASSSQPVDDSRPRTGQTRRLRDIGLPMAILAVTLPLAYQSDRVVLSHVSGLHAVAVYSLVNVVYAPLFSVVATAGAVLWPMFMRIDHTERRFALVKALRVFTASGLVLGAALVGLGPFVAKLVGAHSLTAGLGVYWSFALLLLVFAVHYPSGMFLMDPAGLRYQAIGSILMVLANIPLSIYLSTQLGAAGPPLGSALAIVFFMAAPAYARAMRTSAPAEVGGVCHT